MKKPIVLGQIFLFRGFVFSAVAYGQSLGVIRSDSLLSTHKPEQANYILARYVISSGGVTNATSPNHFHSATVG